MGQIELLMPGFIANLVFVLTFGMHTRTAAVVMLVLPPCYADFYRHSLIAQ